ncbi:hypothetical protein [Caldicoprobacter algeriensis]|uniref:hypothetical protein n=1 Tax=Caldicoprobacter algeriensis TaxID=699281 RepID=UPI00207A216D|nr:hypothetical protein [Caldicoprobacter algeriensis]
MYKEISQYLVGWIRSKVDEAHARGCAVGISRGVDSAVVAALCVKACPLECGRTSYALLQFAVRYR